MTFLNATLLAGLAAIAVPIALHLIARREPRRVVFPAVRFLTRRYESNRSRLQVKRWWLLALRILAIAVFALALARPAISRSLSMTWLTIGLITIAGVGLLVMATVAVVRRQSRSLAIGLGAVAGIVLLAALLWSGITMASGPAMSVDQSAPVSLAIVLDNSPTSGWKTPDDDRISRMQDLATWMATRVPPTSRIAILDRSAHPATFSLDVAGALTKIESLQPLDLVQPITSRIESAVRLVRTSDLENRQVLVVTDLTQSTWDQTTLQTDLRPLLEAEPGVALTIFDLGDFQRNNRWLSIPKVSDPTPPPDTKVSVAIDVGWDKFADQNELSVTAELQLYQNDPALPVVRDGKLELPPLQSVDRTSAQLVGGNATRLLLWVPPLKVGSYHGRVRLLGEDPLAVDDTRFFSLQVLPSKPMLLVGDDEVESIVMSEAISDEFAVESIGFDDLAVIRLEDYPAIVMLDPPADVLSDELVANYVASGGALLVCLGPALGEDGIEAAGLPNFKRRWRVPPPGTFLQPVETSHPIITPLREISGGIPWGNFRIHQYWQLETEPTDIVLIRYAGTGHPALVERKVPGANKVTGNWLLMSTPLPALASETRGWNELFSAEEYWPAFLLVRQLADYLGHRSATLASTPVGQPRIEWVAQSDDNPSDLSTSRRLQLFRPSGSPVPLEIAAGADQVLISDVSKAGTYWLRGAGSDQGFSANLANTATSLDRIETHELDPIFGSDTYVLATNRDEIELAESDASKRVLLYDAAMLLMLIVFVLEQILGNRFYRSGPGGKTLPVSGRTAA